MGTDDLEITDHDVSLFQQAIAKHSVYDFSGYSVNSIRRRLNRITEEYGMDLNRLIKTINTDPVALEEVVKKITVNTTELFRDPLIWQSLRHKLLPRFLSHSEINIWHPGCSTGQEVFSMMILLDSMGLLERSNIYASDINSDVLETARTGIYRLRFNREYIDNYSELFNSREADPVPYSNYFRVDEAKDSIRMADYLCEKPVYKKIDLVKDENLFFKKFDIISCRNVIIYFNYDLQNRVLSMFHRNLNRNGALILGMHESIIGRSGNLFRKEDQFYIRISPEQE